jgi:diguanylate cyclase (GGDEF)-like protein
MVRQLRILTSAVVATLYAAALVITAVGSRSACEGELAGTVAEVARSMAPALGEAIARGDRSAADTVLEAAVGRADVRVASLAAVGADPWVSRERAAGPPAAPGWVATLLPLTARQHATEVGGGDATGRLILVPDPAATQGRVWQAVYAVAGPAAGAFLALMLVAWGAIGVVLRPLRSLESQALAALQWEAPAGATIDSGDPVIDSLQELARRSRLLLAGAQGLAETLHERASRDPLTGLLTRSWLLDILEYRRRDPEQAWTGALLLIRVDGIKGVNDTFGYAAGDDVLRESARLLDETLGHAPDVLIAHLAGGEFAAFVPCAGPIAARELVVAVNQGFRALAGRLRFPSSLLAYAGGAYFHGQTVSALFAEADRDLRKTEWRNVPGAAANATRPRLPEPAGEAELQAAALDAVRKGALRLVLQPIVAFESRDLLHFEAFTRLHGPDGAELMPIGELLAVGAPDLAAEVDRSAVSAALRRLADQNGGHELAVNLSASSLHVAGMAKWLESAAKASPAEARRLILELPDPAIQAAASELGALAARLSPYGVQFAVDHFGTGATSFQYLHRLPLKYVKIDGSFAARLERHTDSRCYVRAAAQIAHGLGMRVYVEAIETEAQWLALDGLGVDGAQGYHLGRPA